MKFKINVKLFTVFFTRCSDPLCVRYQVIIIQPQAPSSTEGSPGAPADLPSQEEPPAPKSPSQKKDEDPEVRK